MNFNTNVKMNTLYNSVITDNIAKNIINTYLNKIRQGKLSKEKTQHFLYRLSKCINNKFFYDNSLKNEVNSLFSDKESLYSKLFKYTKFIIDKFVNNGAEYEDLIVFANEKFGDMTISYSDYKGLKRLEKQTFSSTLNSYLLNALYKLVLNNCNELNVDCKQLLNEQISVNEIVNLANTFITTNKIKYKKICRYLLLCNIYMNINILLRNDVYTDEIDTIVKNNPSIFDADTVEGFLTILYDSNLKNNFGSESVNGIGSLINLKIYSQYNILYGTSLEHLLNKFNSLFSYYINVINNNLEMQDTNPAMFQSLLYGLNHCVINLSDFYSENSLLNYLEHYTNMTNDSFNQIKTYKVNGFIKTNKYENIYNKISEKNKRLLCDNLRKCADTLDTVLENIYACYVTNEQEKKLKLDILIEMCLTEKLLKHHSDAVYNMISYIESFYSVTLKCLCDYDRINKKKSIKLEHTNILYILYKFL